MEKQWLQDSAELEIHLWLPVDIAFAEATKRLAIAAVDIGRVIQMDDPRLQMTLIV